MNRFYISSLMIFILAILVASCSHRLVGNWEIQKYARIHPGEQSTSLTNIGTMTFQRNGKGSKNIQYTVLGVERIDNSSFTWSATDKFVTLHSPDSEFSKTWIVITNKRKFQRWQSTDGGTNVQTIELKK